MNVQFKFEQLNRVKSFTDFSLTSERRRLELAGSAWLAGLMKGGWSTVYGTANILLDALVADLADTSLNNLATLEGKQAVASENLFKNIYCFKIIIIFIT